MAEKRKHPAVVAEERARAGKRKMSQAVLRGLASPFTSGGPGLIEGSVNPYLEGIGEIQSGIRHLFNPANTAGWARDALLGPRPAPAQPASPAPSGEPTHEEMQRVWATQDQDFANHQAAWAASQAQPPVDQQPHLALAPAPDIGNAGTEWDTMRSAAAGTLQGMRPGDREHAQGRMADLRGQATPGQRSAEDWGRLGITVDGQGADPRTAFQHQPMDQPMAGQPLGTGRTPDQMAQQFSTSPEARALYGMGGGMSARERQLQHGGLSRDRTASRSREAREERQRNQAEARADKRYEQERAAQDRRDELEWKKGETDRIRAQTERTASLATNANERTRIDNQNKQFNDALAARVKDNRLDREQAGAIGAAQAALGEAQVLINARGMDAETMAKTYQSVFGSLDNLPASEREFWAFKYMEMIGDPKFNEVLEKRYPSLVGLIARSRGWSQPEDKPEDEKE